MKTETITVQSDGSPMNVYIARSDSKNAPGLLLFQEAFGVNDHIKDVCRRFAEQGYVVAAPELFHRTAPPGWTAPYGDFEVIKPHFQAITTDALAADAKATYEWLKNDSQIDTMKIGAIGFCMGGRATFIANGTLPLQAAISFYGGGTQNILDLAPSQSAPELFFWGGLDQHLGPEQRQAVTDAMTKAGKSYISVVISDANHAFFCDARPAYNPIAAKHAWALTLSFLETNLKS